MNVDVTFNSVDKRGYEKIDPLPQNCSGKQMDSAEVYTLLHLVTPYITDVRSLVLVHSLRELALDKFECPIDEYVLKRARFKEWKRYRRPRCLRYNSWRRRVVSREEMPILFS